MRRVAWSFGGHWGGAVPGVERWATLLESRAGCCGLCSPAIRCAWTYVACLPRYVAPPESPGPQPARAFEPGDSPRSHPLKRPRSSSRRHGVERRDECNNRVLGLGWFWAGSRASLQTGGGERCAVWILDRQLWAGDAVRQGLASVGAASAVLGVHGAEHEHGGQVAEVVSRRLGGSPVSVLLLG